MARSFVKCMETLPLSTGAYQSHGFPSAGLAAGVPLLLDALDANHIRISDAPRDEKLKLAGE